MSLAVLKLAPGHKDHLLGSVRQVRRQDPQNTNGGLGDLITSGMSALKPFGESLLGIGSGITKVVLGLVGLTGGITLAAIFKEGTLADWGSKILAFMGLIFGIFGVKDLMNFNKSKKSELAPEPHRIRISEVLSTGCKSAEAAIISQDLRFKEKFDPSNPGLVNANSAAALRPQIIDLLKNYTNDEIVSKLTSDDGGYEPVFSNISEDPISYNSLRDRVAVLLGNVVSSRTDDNPLGVPAFANILTVDKLDEKLAKILPNEFDVVFNLARFYADTQYKKNDSIESLIGGEDKIADLNAVLAVAPMEGPSSDKAYEYLTTLQNAENFLKVLKQVIVYVKDNSASTDPKIARNVLILRQALITGFRLKGNNLSEINQQLQNIVNGVEISPTEKYFGLDAKITQLEEHFNEELAEFFNNEKFPFVRESDSIGGSDILDRLNLSEIIKK